MTTIPHTLAGIPCLIEVRSYVKVSPWRGSPETCPSSDDYYGYTECEWGILDRKGYKAPWLERKLTPYEKDQVEIAIANYQAEED